MNPDNSALTQLKTFLAGYTSRSAGNSETGKANLALFSGKDAMKIRLVARELAEEAGMSIRFVVLSPVESKYIGETEKNLSKLFDRTEEKAPILFFDEADALFGKRTDVKDSHDRYANQELNYMLEKISSYPGLVILSVSGDKPVEPAFRERLLTVVDI